MALSDDEAKAATETVNSIIDDLSTVVVGQDAAIRELWIGLLADGHVLLEGIPGVGKTLLSRALARALGLTFTRVQFTPDLMPADLLGTRVWDQEKTAWELHKGPVFTEVLLADEVNRTPPKTQAALLEAMGERQVTLDGERHDLGRAFFVIATENPLEFEGTYPLPEAQTDRFLLKITMSYPGEAAELALLGGGQRSASERLAAIDPRLSADALTALRETVRAVRVDDDLVHYVYEILEATRHSDVLKLGASPRAGLMLLAAAQAAALLDGRSYVIPDDVKQVTGPVLRHRLALGTEAELDGLDTDEVLRGLLTEVPVRGAGA